MEARVGKPVTACVAPSASGHRHHGFTEWLVLGLLVMLWGSAFAVLRIGVETIAPVWVVALRGWAAVAFVAAVYPMLRTVAGGKPCATRCDVGAISWFVLIGVLFTALPVFVFAEAARTESSAALAICNGASPVFTALLAHRMLVGERLSWRRGLGVSMGMAGLILLVSPGLLGLGGARSHTLLGAIGAAGLYAAGNIATRRAPQISAALSSLIITLSGAVVMTGLALASEPWPEDPGMPSWLAIAALGVGPSGMATLAYVWLVRKSGPMFVAFATYLSPVWAAGIGVVFLQESLDWSMLGALGFILIGVMVANSRRRQN